MNEREDYGTVKIWGRLYKMTGRGFVLYLVGGSVVGLVGVYVLVLGVLFVLLP